MKGLERICKDERTRKNMKGLERIRKDRKEYERSGKINSLIIL